MTFKFKIIEKRNLWLTLSLIVIFFSFGLMAKRAIQHTDIMNYGIDFIGGTSMMLRFDELNQQLNSAGNNIDQINDINLRFISNIRSALNEIGEEKNTIQITRDNEVIIKSDATNTSETSAIRAQLEKNVGSYEILEIDQIGPTIGNELRETSITIIILATIALLLYITWRFQFSYGVAAIIALLHDACIVIGMAAIFEIEVNTSFVAALLTVLGYSINDTIVVFDRIRENVRRKSSDTLTEIINLSLNQTLVRTINTSLTTIVVITSLLVLGGSTIQAFAMVLLIGVLSGTYSSLFIASPILKTLLEKSAK